MLPRYLLWLCFYISPLVTNAQERGKSVSFTENFSSLKQISRNGHQVSFDIKKDSFPCYCSVSPQIIPVSNEGLNRTYQGIPNAACISISTPPAPGPNPVRSVYSNFFDTCGVSNVTYAWSIVAGNNIASIDGSNTGSTVNVVVNGSGSYTIRLENMVTCNSGSTCSNFAYYNDSARIDSSHCTCSAGPVTIQPTNKTGNTWTYQGSSTGSCSGQYGIVPNLDSCGIQNTIYAWSISAPNGVASLNGPTDNPTVNVSITGNGPFTLRLDVSTFCSDGKSCSNYNFYFDTAKVETPKHCQCVSPEATIQPANRGDSIFSYQAQVMGQCTGQYGTPPDLIDCAIQNITYNWFISSGGDVAEILGNDQGPAVDVRIKGSGKFTLQVFGDVICNEGNKCAYMAYIDDSVSNEKTCKMTVEENVEPKMDGGLQQRYNGTHRIERDEFIVLGAEGKDYDQVKFTCTPSADCNETGSDKTVILNSRVRFEWAITGGGNFVKLGGLPQNIKNATGDYVIFQPPYVPLPETGNESSVTTTVKLSILDDNPSQPVDPTVERTITIITKRFKNAPNEYTVTVQSAAFTLPGIPSIGPKIGDCKTVGPTWEQKTDLKKPEIELPGVADKDKMVVGEWIILDGKDQRDNDLLKMVCESAKCTGDGNQKTYEDNIAWEWTLVPGPSNGRFVSDTKGRFVVYEAPEKLPDNKDIIEVKIRLKVMNADALKAVDVIPPEGEITLKIYRAGIKMDYPPLTWLPEGDNNVAIKSYLVYKDGGKWLPGLAHQFRIQFFEMLDVSTEPGVCMNDPVAKDADECRDLFIDTSSNHELFNDKKTKNCSVAELYLEARTKLPVKEYNISIRSRDFGSYGYLRSEASRNKKPDYESVPIVLADVPHPVRGVIKRPPYKDNRINIPRDVDENRIADGGWRSPGNVLVADPADNKADDDNNPAGDNFKGDGLTTYEEYRGFRVVENRAVVHIRTNPDTKDLFIHNPDALPLNLFRQESSLSVHEISTEQYTNNATRVINFNSNTRTHLLDQKGLFLMNGGNNASLLGIALGANGEPAPPNWVDRVIVYNDKITAFCGAPRNLNFNNKLAQVTAHELAHACNVYHHGEGDPAVEGSFNAVHGLRSGNVSCIMRYDNIQAAVQEAIGTTFCTSAAGTGSNANNQGFGDANTTLCRGNCLHQFRVSGRQNAYPKRVTRGDCQRIRNP